MILYDFAEWIHELCYNSFVFYSAKAQSRLNKFVFNYKFHNIDTKAQIKHILEISASIFSTTLKLFKS